MTRKYRALFALELHVKIATLALTASGCPSQSLYVPKFLNSREQHEGHMSLCQQGANIFFLLETSLHSLKTRGLHSDHQKLLVDQVYRHHLKRFQEHLVLSIYEHSEPRQRTCGYLIYITVPISYIKVHLTFLYKIV